ncbi:hypothetical protein [Micavibrio aeruginosavorus]|uniref:hypothetical protein n=1 Tax=Micavibrio aeruginosavorus TaxID=349221 RepID=UPI003F4AF75D
MTTSFPTETRHQFDSIAEQFGLSRVTESLQQVRYENDLVFLLIHWDNTRSYEIGVEIGKKCTSGKDQSFPLHVVLKKDKAPDADRVSNLMVSDEKNLPAILQNLADIVMGHASDLLSGSEQSFAQIEAFSHHNNVAYAQNAELQHAKLIADKAWSEKDYVSIVRALEPVEENLSDTDKARLEYARKHHSS